MFAQNAITFLFTLSLPQTNRKSEPNRKHKLLLQKVSSRFYEFTVVFLLEILLFNLNFLKRFRKNSTFSKLMF